MVDHEVGKDRGGASRNSYLTINQNHSAICLGIADKCRDLLKIGIHPLKRPVLDFDGQVAFDGKRPLGRYSSSSSFESGF